ncbi:uncharacterized protein LOC143540249 [Bidens hawaiensis]|uniref:uncharacterized protein LOC143540249 n=1 Tax=Bidens hawaiensis TaxID=980011 RepID=UPI0040493165
MLHGSIREHYSQIRSYLAALKQFNPNSTFELVTAPPGFNNQEPDSNLETIFRFFVCFDGGVLLAAIGRDANDQMYPVAWVVVEEHRNCARHIYANWKKMFKGKDLKMYYWQACRAYNEPDFNDAIKGMRDISTDAVEAFMKQNPNCFVRCFLKNNTYCDVIVSNMAGTFNGTIVEARSMHIINMLETIRVSTMTRIITKHSEMLAQDVVVCPRIQKKLDRGKKWAHKYFDEDLAVDLNSKRCSSRKWDLTGIPCKHVCSVAGFLGRNDEQFVDECYLTETYLRTYSHTIAATAKKLVITLEGVQSLRLKPHHKLMQGEGQQGQLKSHVKVNQHNNQ